MRLSLKNLLILKHYEILLKTRMKLALLKLFLAQNRDKLRKYLFSGIINKNKFVPNQSQSSLI